MTSKAPERWSSRATFILAAVGSAVGLANLWRFPYSVGTGGGSAFVFVYLGAVLLVSLPVLIAELMVGRRGRLSPPQAIGTVAREGGASPAWAGMGYVGGIGSLIVLAFYSVVGGWTLAYAGKALTGASPVTAAEASAAFDGLNASAPGLFACFAVFIGATIAVSALGVQKGIERVVKIMMPALFLILLSLAAYALIAGEAAKAMTFLFKPDFSKITGAVVMDAVGQAFFSLGVGMTNLMAYGAYVDRDTSIPRTSLFIVGADTAVALIAGIAIFPIVFAVGLAPDSGPGLVFQTLPVAFAQMPGGSLIAPAFFFLLFFAALTSSISMIEAPVSWLQGRFGWSRVTAALVPGAISFGLGVLCVLSFNILSGFHPLDGVPLLEGRNFFALFDYLVTTLMMPGCAIFIALFVAWALPKALTRDEFGVAESGYAFGLWRFCLRYVAPLALAAVLIGGAMA
ncbi:sodium-dependent transporter [Gimibacter soli]|uniref:Sodium-dependent transporter n=1 Tax=Gimibacter soli TaxID=3024400 RepID=A0AAE9XSQ1_9PROT|nr:sodium-dependent transporter [Gimibacter soli]WCL53345.1 sodium-dependent transporter [Gimibacter soli]